MSGPTADFAFTLGLAAAVNPCGLPLLPVYLTHVAAAPSRVGTGRRLRTALTAVLLMSIGAALTYGISGALVLASLTLVLRIVPWMMLIVAAAMIAVGVAGALGRMHPRLCPVLVTCPRWMRGPFWFGVEYALASSTCTLPLFLVGIVGNDPGRTPLATIERGMAYGAGTAVMLCALATPIVLGRTAWLRVVRRFARRLPVAGWILLALLGCYLLGYWVTAIFFPLHPFAPTRVIDAAQARVADWLPGAAPWLAAAVVLVLLAVAATSIARRATRFIHRPAAPLLATTAVLAVAGLAAAALLPHAAQQPAAQTFFGIGTAAQETTGLTPIRPPTPAPSISLVDQDGRPVTLNAFRGKVVVLAFLDDRCQDVCLLYPADVRQAAARLGHLNDRVEFVGINVNPLHTQATDVAAFTTRERLDRLPNWRFLTGPPAALRQIAAEYGVYERLQGRAVDHAAVLWFLDARGRERAAAVLDATAQAADRWGASLDAVVRALLGAPFTTPHFTPPEPGDPKLRGIDVAGGGNAPGFALPRLDTDGTRLSLAALRGRPVVLNFWASWCQPCQAELPTLQSLSDAYRGRVSFVGVDVADQPSHARDLAAQAGISYPLLVDQAGAASNAYRVVNLPTTVIIGPRGDIVLRHTGEVTSADLQPTLDRLTRATP